MQLYCVVLEFIVVKATVDIVQWYCVWFGGYCGGSNSRYSAMVLCCFVDFVVKAKVDIVQWYCVVCGVYCGERNSRYSAMVLCCVVDYCGYSNSRYSAIVLCCVRSLLW